MLIIATTHSQNKSDNHTPSIKNTLLNITAEGTSIKKPLHSDIICAGTAFSIDISTIEIIILKPKKGVAVK